METQQQPRRKGKRSFKYIILKRDADKHPGPNESLQAAHILAAIRMMYTATIIFLCLAVAI